MPVGVVLNQIAILAVVVLIGVIVSHFRVITTVSRDYLARIIFNITLPPLLFTNFSNVDLTPRILSNSLAVLVMSAAILLLMLSIGIISSRILALDKKDAGIFRLHSMLGNIIYLGFPVISSLFGEVGLIYASIFTLVSNFLMWTIGVVAVTSAREMSFRKNLAHMLNPNTIAIVTGFILFLLGIKLPPVILKPLSGLGASTTWLSMIYIGSVLYFTGVGSLKARGSVFLLAFNRLLLVPFILLGMFMIINSIFPGLLDPLVVSVLVMQSAMPCMVNVVIMVNILGEDDTQAAVNVFITTILSILTIPLVIISLGLLN